MWLCTLMSLRGACHALFPDALPAIIAKVLMWQRHRSTFPRQKHYENKLLLFYWEGSLQATASGRKEMLNLLYFRVKVKAPFCQVFV